MVYQKIRRAIIAPSYAYPATADEEEIHEVTRANLAQLAENYSRLAREVIDCHNQIQVYQLPVVGAAVLRVVNWIPPFFDLNYSAFCTPNWATTVWFTAQLRTSITFNFGAAAPGPGGIILVIGIR